MGSAHLISVGQFEGGVLTRGFSDLHPELTRYTVLWNGTIAAMQQKSEQRDSPSPTHRRCAACHQPLVGFLTLRTYHPACRPNVTEPERPRMKSDAAQALLIERRRARRAA